MIRLRWRARLLYVAGLILAARGLGQEPDGVEVRLQIAQAHTAKHHAAPAVVWLEPRAGAPALAFPPHGRFVLMQKNRMFAPHLLIVPVGSVVTFPNADPFFHNVFSLFDGKRFDLGLYEAGMSKSVTFSRVGVSYIFCNIHPEMSAVVLSLSSPLYAVTNEAGAAAIPGVPPGDYALHVWIEGVRPAALEHLGRPVHVPDGGLDLGKIALPEGNEEPQTHTNEYGKPYAPNPTSPY